MKLSLGSLRSIFGAKQIALGGLIVTIIAPVAVNITTVYAEPGTEGNPYLIESCEDLMAMESDMEAYYRLGASLVCNDLIPIGAAEPFPEFFTGGLDGNGLTIDFTTAVEVQNSETLGLFAAIGMGALVQNLNLTGTVTGVPEGNQCVSSLAAFAFGPYTIENVHSSVNLSGVYCVGGFIGESYASFDDSTDVVLIRDSTYDGTITAGLPESAYVTAIGGFIATTQDGAGSHHSIVSSSFSGSVDITEGENIYGVGGFIGTSESFYLSEVNSNGSISTDHEEETYGVGGFIGGIDDGNTKTIEKSKGSTDISVTADFLGSVGGLIGESYDTLLTDTYYDGAITTTATSSELVGGLIGYSYLGTVNRSFVSGTIDVTATDYSYGVGGIIGNSEETIVQNSFGAANISVNSPDSDYAAGIVGYVYYDVEFSEITPDEALVNVYVDETKTGYQACALDENEDSISTGCTVVNSDGNDSEYFENNTTNPPLNEWDFESIWAVTPGYPELSAFKSEIEEPVSLPNGGDLNNDGTADSEQVNVRSFLSSLTNRYVAVSFDETCMVDSAEVKSEDSLAVMDSGFDYSEGFMAFSTQCTVPDEEEGEIGPGDGTELNPYRIDTCLALRDVEDNMGDYYILVADLVCDEFEPIGYTGGMPNSFSGSFDGNGYSITFGHNVNDTGGLFAYLEDGAVIFDLDIAGNVNSDVSAGGLAGVAFNGFEIRNVHSTVEVTGTNTTVGGLIGYVEGSGPENTIITDCSVVADLYGESVGNFNTIGGIVAHAENAQIDNCSYTGTIDVSDTGNTFTMGIGGIGGYLENTNINSVTATANINVSTAGNIWRVGGIVGEYDSFSEATNVVSNVDFSLTSGTDTSYVGGLYGLVGLTLPDDTNFSSQSYSGSMLVDSGEDAQYVGGAVGYVHGGEIYSGEAGFNRIAANVDMDLTAAGSIQYIGGLFGSLSHYELTHSFAEGSILLSAVDDSSDIGGIAGSLGRQDIASDIYAEVAITVGETNTASYDEIGGIAGVTYDTVLENAYSSGSINVENANDVEIVGGLIGEFLDSGGGLSNSFGATQITWKTEYPATSRGGVIGHIGDPEGIMSNMFYDQTRSMVAACAFTNFGGTEVTEGCTEENFDNENPDIFQGNSSDAPLDTWDFDAVWLVREGDYPGLRGINPSGYTTPGPAPQDAFTITVKLYYYGLNSEGLLLRKHLPDTESYFTINEAEITQETIDGYSVVVATYTVTDGGILDIDGEVNGTIVDPVGLGSAVLGAPNAGVAPEFKLNDLLSLKHN